MEDNKISAATVAREIADSYRKAREVHDPMRGPHEGYAVLLEEVDELWEEVKAWKSPQQHMNSAPPPIAEAAIEQQKRKMRKEALHVAAMALAFILEVCE